MSKKKPNIIGIIPARMSSTRFPGKALADIHGMPMIGHVYHRVKMNPLLDEVYLAIDGKELEEYADSIGAKWVRDKKKYRGCSNAIAAATLEIERRAGKKVDAVVLIQGDEPMTVPEMITMAVEPMVKDPSIKVINLMAPIETEEEHNDPNCPKVVVDKEYNALYFSREPIPSRKKWDGKMKIPMYKQVCVIPFNRDYLIEYSNLEPTPLELIESIDMNRVLEHGDKVKMVLEDHKTQAVDTPQDLEKVKDMMKNDPLLKEYVT